MVIGRWEYGYSKIYGTKIYLTPDENGRDELNPDPCISFGRD
jgi:hypothetical protein